MKCERCSALRGNEALVRIRTDIIDLAVCDQCAKEAYDLGQACERLAQPKACDGKRLVAAAA